MRHEHGGLGDGAIQHEVSQVSDEGLDTALIAQLGEEAAVALGIRVARKPKK